MRGTRFWLTFAALFLSLIALVIRLVEPEQDFAFDVAFPAVMSLLLLYLLRDALAQNRMNRRG